MNESPPSGQPARLRALIESRAFQGLVLGLIFLNAITLGLESDASIMERHGTLLHAIDTAVLAVFVLELVLRLSVHRLGFFRDAWSLFDLAIVLLALVPAMGPFAVLRALRILRALRLVSMVPSMRRVVEALLGALPGMASIGALLALLLYVAGVLATKLFGALEPEYFGSLGRSLFTLFQIMTLEGWADIARQLMAERPWAWFFFVVYILVSTFAVLNLFIAVVVNAMQEQVNADMQRAEDASEQAAKRERAEILAELRALRARLELTPPRA